MRRKYTHTCAQCGTPFHPNNRTERFCSRSCATRATHATRDLALASRFWSKADKSDTCWRWTGGTFSGRYGRFKDKGAHVVAWELTYGPVPDGLFVCHNCPDGDNPLCVNPAHLWLGTAQENMADRDAKGRQARGDRQGLRRHPDRAARGERNARAKLTEQAVCDIRAARSAGVKLKVLAAQYGVNVSLISAIAHRKVWAHVP